MTDPISDMLTRIRNAVSARHTRVDMPASKLKAEIARILQDEGFIQGYRLVEAPAEKPGRAAQHAELRVFLRYGPQGEKVITASEDASASPGRRVLLRRGKKLPTVLGGLGTSILTSSRGVMTGRACQEAGFGGEVLAMSGRHCVVGED